MHFLLSQPRCPEPDLIFRIAKRRKEENEVPSRRASTSTNTHRNRDTRNTDDSGTSGNSGNTSNSSNAISTCQTSKASNSSTISNMLGNVKLGDVAMVGVAGAACVVVPPVAAAVTTAITTAAGAAVLGGTVYVAGNVLQCGMKCGTACYVWATSENRDGGNVPLICN